MGTAPGPGRSHPGRRLSTGKRKGRQDGSGLGLCFLRVCQGTSHSQRSVPRYFSSDPCLGLRQELSQSGTSAMGDLIARDLPRASESLRHQRGIVWVCGIFLADNVSLSPFSLCVVAPYYALSRRTEPKPGMTSMTAKGPPVEGPWWDFSGIICTHKLGGIARSLKFGLET